LKKTLRFGRENSTKLSHKTVLLLLALLLLVALKSIND